MQKYVPVHRQKIAYPLSLPSYKSASGLLSVLMWNSFSYIFSALVVKGWDLRIRKWVWAIEVVGFVAAASESCLGCNSFSLLPENLEIVLLLVVCIFRFKVIQGLGRRLFQGQRLVKKQNPPKPELMQPSPQSTWSCGEPKYQGRPRATLLCSSR